MSILSEARRLLKVAAENSKEDFILKKVGDKLEGPFERGTSAALVALSGGKDSLTIAELACEVFDRVEAYFMYMVPGLRCVEDHIDAVGRRLGIPVHKTIHYHAANMMKEGVMCAPREELAGLPWFGINDVENLIKQKTGIVWTISGMRAAESIQRRGMLNSLQGINEMSCRVYPIWQWHAADVFAFLQHHQIALPRNFGHRGEGHSAGFNLMPQTLAMVKREYPKDYAKILEMFPFAETQIARAQYAGLLDADGFVIPKLKPKKEKKANGKAKRKEGSDQPSTDAGERAASKQVSEVPEKAST